MKRNRQMGKELMQRAKETMSSADMALLTYLLKLLKPNQSTLTVVFHVKSFVTATKQPENYSTFTKIVGQLEDIAGDSFFIKHPNGNYGLEHWISGIVAKPTKEGIPNFYITFNSRLKTYLLGK